MQSVLRCTLPQDRLSLNLLLWSWVLLGRSQFTGHRWSTVLLTDVNTVTENAQDGKFYMYEHTFSKLDQKSDCTSEDI